MTSADMGKIKSQNFESNDRITTPFIKLLYFIPKSSFNDDLQLKDSMFLFPDDTTITGSVSFFRCLMRQMVDKSLLAVGRMLRGASGEARLVVLYPTDEKTDSEGYLEEPGGLYVITVPFIQEIRNVTEATANLSSENESAATKSALMLVQSLQFGSTFKYTDLESPGIQYFYSMLQALALAAEKCEWNPVVDDMLLPDPESLQVHEGVIKNFENATGLCDEEEDSAKKTVIYLLSDFICW